MKKRRGFKMIMTMLMNLYIILGVIFSTPSCKQNPSAAEYTLAANDVIHVVKSQKISKIIVKLPENYNSSREYPVLFALHGNGGDGAGIAQYFNEYANLPVIYVIPQGMYLKTYGGYSWYYETSNKKIWEFGDLLTVDNFLEIVNEVKSYYKIGDVYIFGFSEGASAAYMAGLKYPSTFKGIAAVGGVLPDIDGEGAVIFTQDVAKAKNLRVFVARGLSDNLTLKKDFNNQINYLKGKGLNVDSFEYPGGHEITRPLLLKIFEWIGTGTTNN